MFAATSLLMSKTPQFIAGVESQALKKQVLKHGWLPPARPICVRFSDQETPSPRPCTSPTSW